MCFRYVPERKILSSCERVQKVHNSISFPSNNKIYSNFIIAVDAFLWLWLCLVGANYVCFFCPFAVDFRDNLPTFFSISLPISFWKPLARALSDRSSDASCFLRSLLIVISRCSLKLHFCLDFSTRFSSSGGMSS